MNILKQKNICLRGVLKSVHSYEKTQEPRTGFSWSSFLIFENSSQFSREPPGLPLTDFWGAKGSGFAECSRPPRALELARPTNTGLLLY